MSDFLPASVSIAGAFLLGSLPFAYWVARAVAGIDIRLAGSGNPGALNVYRQVGGKAALAVVLLDVAKGAVAVLLPRWLGAPEPVLYLAAFTAVAGHNWSVFLGLRGGKGAATVAGISLTLLPLLTVVVVPFLALALMMTKNAVVSIALTFILLNVLTIATAQPLAQIGLCMGLSILVAGTHLYRAGAQIVPAVKEKRWTDITRVE
ncbi:MAG: glycerol-3-phosphate acyltransferase [Chloroflexi bacterium]|nr:glycerol-3-phosphate acyltransferase [Chloroflexota bacterium]